MRKVSIYCLVLFSVLALFPIFAIIISGENEKITINTTEATDEISQTKEEINADDVVILTLTMVDEDFCDEGILAALAIARNNLNCNTDNNILSNNLNTHSKNKSLEKRVHKLYKKLDIEITYQNKSVFIPSTSLTKGYTETNENYLYIEAVASPWDCFDNDFVHNKEYGIGVSLKGIDYLCKNGADYKEALRWYLPDFEIK